MQSGFNTAVYAALPKRFLVIDDHADGRSLLVRTLLRKFPQSVVVECQDPGTGTTLAAKEQFDAIIAHRAGELTGLELLGQLRRISPEVPIVMVSGIDRSKECLAAGATAFLNYDAWLNIGTLVAELLTKRAPSVAS
jgi:DNA-binding NarL/FixJ family response regulator